MNDVKAEITATYSINSSTMHDIEKWIDQDTLVLIDIDDTIMMPSAQMFSVKASSYRNFINNMVSVSDRIPPYQSIVAKWYQQRKLKLVEDDWPVFIGKLKEKGVKVYGICTMPLHLLDIEQKRYLEAQQLGIVFTNLINNQEQLVIEKETSWFSHFYMGIIFTGPYSKSHTIIEFLRVTNQMPAKMLVISYNWNDIDAIDDDLRVFNMDNYCVHYLGITKVPGTAIPAIVELQQQELINNGRWLEDADAAAILKSKKTN